MGRFWGVHEGFIGVYGGVRGVCVRDLGVSKGIYGGLGVIEGFWGGFRGQCECLGGDLGVWGI